jgi:hypothetical protein
LIEKEIYVAILVTTLVIWGVSMFLVLCWFGYQGLHSTERKPFTKQEVIQILLGPITIVRGVIWLLKVKEGPRRLK